MTFEDAKQQKFDRGHREHQQEWSPDVIDAKAEIMDELLDLANYAELLERDHPRLAAKIYTHAKALWHEVNDV